MKITINDILENTDFKHLIGNLDKEITSIYCCDLLSNVICRCPANSCWITIMSHINSVAAAIQANVSCIVVAENHKLAQDVIENAKKYGVTILSSKYPTFETSNIIFEIEKKNI